MRAFLRKNQRPLSIIVIFVALLSVFAIANPRVFFNPIAYTAIFTTLPIAIILTAALVFMVTSGEIDLSFPSVMGLAAWGFASTAKAGLSPFLGLIFAFAIGLSAGFLNGLLVTKLKLSSLVSTLGMNFLLRGLINIGTQGIGIPLTDLNTTFFYNLFAKRLGGFPVQMIWGLGFAIVGALVFNRHKFGAQVCCVGDNEESAREMGINVEAVRVGAFMVVGLAAAFAGVLSALINQTFWPTTGDGYLLIILAAVFVGGTPTWGGIGTVTGGIIGAFIVSFIETGIIAAGLTGFYTQFFYGLVIILAIAGHRLNRESRRFAR